MIEDPIHVGIASGWKVINGSALTTDINDEADVVIIGSGAGGGVTAETLTRAGLRVILVEEGPLKSSSDFKMREPEAYASLYQEGGARKTKDNAIFVYQGRTVGGSTTINWTSSFRTPPRTLEVWASEFGLTDLKPKEMAPWFETMETQLSMQPNANNNLLKIGGDKLGIETGIISRNVKGCWNLGYCGLGCPTNAKQSMLVTMIPSALAAEVTLYHHIAINRFRYLGDKIDAAEGFGLEASTRAPTGRKVTIRARHYVLAAGGINGPGLLLRSKTPDPHGNLGRRTFLHPTSLSMALLAESINAFHGAPQTVYSDHYCPDEIDGPIGYKLEAAVIHPIFAATTLVHGPTPASDMAQLPYMQSLLSLLRDGFHPESPGGKVELRDDGSPVLDYPISDYVWDGLKRSLLTMAEIQFAAGAKMVAPAHLDAPRYTSWAEARKEIPRLPTKIIRFIIGGAHVRVAAE